MNITNGTIISVVVPIIVAIFASTGFWSFLVAKHTKKNAGDKLLLGLAHYEIINQAMGYINRGSISHDEYENLHDYLYVPYVERGGNGVAKRVMKELEKLEVTSIPMTDSE